MNSIPVLTAYGTSTPDESIIATAIARTEATKPPPPMPTDRYTDTPLPTATAQPLAPTETSTPEPTSTIKLDNSETLLPAIHALLIEGSHGLIWVEE